MIYVIPQTKGGVGKTTFSSNVLPVLLGVSIEDITIYEIDDNNSSKYEKSKMNFKNLNTRNSEGAIEDIYLDNLLEDENKVNIIDCGGGNDTKKIIAALTDAELSGLTYFVPIFDDIDYVQNAIDTINLVKDADADSKVILVFNRCLSLDNEQIQKQFIGVFGDKEIGIKSRLKELNHDNQCFVLNDQNFGIVKTQYQITMLEMYNQSIDLIKNKKKYEQDFIKKGGRELLKSKLPLFRFAKRVIESVDNFDNCKKVI